MSAPGGRRYNRAMRIAAHVEAVEHAAGLLAGAGDGGRGPSWDGGIGHPDADDALSGFSAAIARHAASLAESARQGALGLRMVAHNFRAADS